MRRNRTGPERGCGRHDTQFKRASRRSGRFLARAHAFRAFCRRNVRPHPHDGRATGADTDRIRRDQRATTGRTRIIPVAYTQSRPDGYPYTNSDTSLHGHAYQVPDTKPNSHTDPNPDSRSNPDPDTDSDGYSGAFAYADPDCRTHLYADCNADDRADTRGRVNARSRVHPGRGTHRGDCDLDACNGNTARR